MFTDRLKEELLNLDHQIEIRTARNDELKGLIAERREEIQKFEADYFKVYASWQILFKRSLRLRFLSHFLTLDAFGPGEETPVPPREISNDLKRKFTLDGKIPFEDVYVDDTYPSNHPLIYTDEEIDYYIEMIQAGEYYIYGGLDYHLQEAFKAYPVDGLEVLITGSITPWYEAMCLNYGARPTTVDYNRIVCDSDRISTLTVAEQQASDRQFDCALSISSFEHDGLGGYGDPIDPDGDLKAMENVMQLIKPGGLFFLNVPVGPDAVLFNRQRTYGKIRLPMLLKGWEQVDSYGYDEAKLESEHTNPVFVLRKAR